MALRTAPLSITAVRLRTYKAVPGLQGHDTAVKSNEAMGLINHTKTVMVILTYSTSKNYGVLDVAVSQRLFVVRAPYGYFRSLVL